MRALVLLACTWAGAASGCGECIDGERRCEGSILRRCQVKNGRNPFDVTEWRSRDCADVGAVCGSFEGKKDCVFEDFVCEEGWSSACHNNAPALCSDEGGAARQSGEPCGSIACLDVPSADGEGGGAYCPVTEEPCDEEGATRCEGEASYLACLGGVYGIRRACPDGSHCADVEGAARCLVYDDPCEPASVRCVGDGVVECVDGRYGVEGKHVCEGSFGPSVSGRCVEDGEGDVICPYVRGECVDGEKACASFRIATCRDGAYLDMAACPEGGRCEGEDGAAVCASALSGP